MTRYYSAAYWGYLNIASRIGQYDAEVLYQVQVNSHGALSLTDTDWRIPW